jgi:hypothetical protein
MSSLLQAILPPPYHLINVFLQIANKLGYQKKKKKKFIVGEMCHPQHQEMRVRREVGTDEPVEVVEVEQNSDAGTIPKYVFT